MEEISDPEELSRSIQEQQQLHEELVHIKAERERLRFDKPAPPSEAEPPPSNIVPFPCRPVASPGLRCGNALLLDYLYGVETDALRDLSEERTRQLFDFATSAQAARALRCRRRMLARALDETCQRAGAKARLLCIAGGHFREAELAHELRYGRFGEMLVFDDDAARLEIVRRSYGALGVHTRLGKLEQLLAGECGLEGYDLVYSSGVTELLDDRRCERLVHRLFQAVSPGGRLLLANFRPEVKGIAFLEGLLDWRPRYRHDAQMLSLLDGVDYNQIASARVFHDIGQRIVFLEAVKYG
ncbi:class I SAM-dependent methyltransferase [Metapseudomonas resinovorans]|uniref:class I SAM-dependent methyltransferase n=1 Tax=Metapseudomonas resinovorans TaxID=53412 RepID=UPI00040EB778|nr:class I SAM-dependent methyltransferase [Pseudomonas resinovorans]MDE3737686.1 class I SAM-dependent methyltransferase [Pseudomonas resinovorans]